jgi:hypothetical protein
MLITHKTGCITCEFVLHQILLKPRHIALHKLVNMSESQFPRSLFPQFTEEEIKEVIKFSKDSVNWTEYNKWVEAGRPYEEHDEVLMNLELENGSQARSAGKSIDLYSFCYFIFMIFMHMFGLYIVKLIKFFFKEPNDMLTEKENMEMEAVITEIQGIQIEKPGKQALILLPQKELKPPVNIVVKILDPTRFPKSTEYTNRMIQDLQKDKI